MNKYLLWGASGIVTLIMLMGGAMKLSGQEIALKSFADLGMPGWFGLFIGVCEVCGAIGIWIKRLSSVAAAGIAAIMLGALYYHIQFPPLAAGVPATIVLICAIYVCIRRLPEAFWQRNTA